MKLRYICLYICTALLIHFPLLGKWNGYVASGGSDSLISFELEHGVAEQVLSLGTGATPRHIALLPNGKKGFVTNSGNHETPGHVAAIDMETFKPLGMIETGIEPVGIALMTSGKKGYVTNNASHSVTVFDPIHLMSLKTIDVGLSPRGVAVSPDGKYVFVANTDSNDLSVIDASTDTIFTTIKVGESPHAVAITPNGSTVLVTNRGNWVVNVIDVATMSVIKTIDVGDSPTGLAVAPDGKVAYVTLLKSNSVVGFDIAKGTVASVYNLKNYGGISPIDIALTPNGKSAFVTNIASHNIVQINLVNKVISNPVSLGSGVCGVVISPDQSPVASFTVTLAASGTPSQLDGSASTTPEGTIVSYAWDFGDGQTQVTSTPVVNHIYTSGGSVQASLKVTNSAGTSTDIIFTGQTVSSNGSSLAKMTKSFTINLLPPTNVVGTQFINRTLTQTDIVNLITWKAPSGQVAAYKIYRDSALTQLAGTVPGNGQLRFEDHNRSKNTVYSYYVVSSDQSGNQSSPATVVVQPKKF